MSSEVLTAFDIAQIPLTPADVRAGLQTGLIDTITTPPIGINLFIAGYCFKKSIAELYQATITLYVRR